MHLDLPGILNTLPRSQLGNGETRQSYAPVRVATDIPFLPGTLAAGGDFACALAAYQPIHIRATGRKGESQVASHRMPDCSFL